MRKPIIGITSAYEMEEGLKNYNRTTVSIDYTKGVVAGGGAPIVIPVTGDMDVIREQLSLIDGLLLSGGADINPMLYGQDFKDGIGVIQPERDDCEMKIIKEFLKTGKPILGICRGHQLLNVYFGGTLHQDLKYAGKDILKHRGDFHPEIPIHKVSFLEKDNMLYKLFGKEVLANSFHHQIIDEMGKDLTPIGKTSDGVIEAFYKKDHNFLYGIQWHPEMMTARGSEEMKKVFIEFVNACKK